MWEDFWTFLARRHLSTVFWEKMGISSGWWCLANRQKSFKNVIKMVSSDFELLMITMFRWKLQSGNITLFHIYKFQWLRLENKCHELLCKVFWLWKWLLKVWDCDQMNLDLSSFLPSHHLFSVLRMFCKDAQSFNISFCLLKDQTVCRCVHITQF